MKALVTGAGGWLGSELTKKLLFAGYSVRAFDFKNSENINGLLKKFPNQIEFYEGDITDFNSVKTAMTDIDVIYHLAARVHFIPTTEEERDIFYKVNSEASKVIFDLSMENNVQRVIFYSTVSVYSESEKYIDIESIKNPITDYGKSKLEAEEYGMKAFREKGFPLTIIEPVTVYGGNDRGNFGKLKGLINRGLAVTFGDGNNKKTVIYYEDLIDMTINISKSNETIGKIIICGTEEISLNQINETYISKVNKKVISIKINKTISKLIIVLLKSIGLNRISRNISVLMSNNKYDISESMKYVNGHIKFSEIN